MSTQPTVNKTTTHMTTDRRPIERMLGMVEQDSHCHAQAYCQYSPCVSVIASQRYLV